jgi:hypothetical protein
MFATRNNGKPLLRALGLALVVATLPVPVPASSLPEIPVAPRSNRFT